MEIQEKYIEDSPIPVSIKGTEQILNQMKKCVCKIHNKGIKGTGFFCKIPYPYPPNLFPVLVTNNHILNKSDLEINNTITLSMNDDERFVDIIIDGSRKVYSSAELDTTIIEINLEKDDLKLKLEDFLELDENIKKGNLENIYSKHSVYIINYPKGLNVEVSYGILSIIKDTEIIHNCCTEKGSSGSPILSLNNFKVLGIHCGPDSDSNCNKGIFILYPVMGFCEIKRKVNKNTNINKFKNKIKLNRIHTLSMNARDFKLNSCKTLINSCMELSLNKMTIKYIIKDDKKIQLFGGEFIKRNKGKCKLIINGKEEELYQYLDSKNLGNVKYLEIKLLEKKRITDMSKMFCNCMNLYSLPDISHWDTSLVTNMSFMFCCCVSLASFEGISKWNISNVSNISFMFWGCSTLKAIPDISNWNTAHVTDMSYLFNRCLSLGSLPDISKWDVSRVTKMDYMFNRCQSLTSLPDLNKWNIDKIKEIKGMFNQCNKLHNIPSKFKKYLD